MATRLRSLTGFFQRSATKAFPTKLLAHTWKSTERHPGLKSTQASGHLPRARCFRPIGTLTVADTTRGAAPALNPTTSMPAPYHDIDYATVASTRPPTAFFSLSVTWPKVT